MNDLRTADAPATSALAHEAIDELERRMLAAGAAVGYTALPLVHRFTPGLYAREITMPAGTLITSRIHRTEHMFVVSKGRVSVWADGAWQLIEAPHTGVTKPGTRRVLYIHDDCVWTTFHATPHTTPEAVEEEIIAPHGGHLADVQEALAALRSAHLMEGHP